MMRLLLFCCALALACPLALARTDHAPEADTGRVGVQSGEARRFMAVTANPHATEAAHAILERGGSAVDAAIAAQLVLGLTEPQSSGIGGGAFALHWSAEDQRLTSWDGRETAPAAIGEDHFLREDGEPLGFFDAVVGGHAVGVPGLLAMLDKLHRQHGELPWGELFQPAITLAGRGFAISPRLHRLLERMPRVAVNPEIRAYFFEQDGETPKAEGTVLKNPDYARSLQLIAEQGIDVFYRGELAEAMVEAVANDPVRSGTLSLTDLDSYRATTREPVCGAFRQYRVCGMAPPSSGGVTVIGILGMLAELGERPGEAVPRLHRFAEASRLAFADRDHYLADPDFAEVPTEGLVDPDYLARRARLIADERAMSEGEPGTPPSAGELARTAGISTARPATTHLNIVDAEGNIVSMTSSIEMGFGSRILVGGFLLNNQLTDFDFVPRGENDIQVANRPQAGKRPLSSMAPTLVFENDQPVLAIGSPGGRRIIHYVARSLWDILDGGFSLEAAVTAGHVSHIGSELTLEAENHAAEVRQALEALGHSVEERSMNSGLHVIRIGKDGLKGAADPRREGTVKGH